MAYNHLIWMYWVCVFVCVWITSTQELKRHLLSALCNYSHLEAISNVRRVENSRLPHMYPGAGKLFAFDICPNQWTSIFWIFWVPFTTFISFSFSDSCVCVLFRGKWFYRTMAPKKNMCEVLFYSQLLQNEIWKLALVMHVWSFPFVKVDLFSVQYVSAHFD